MGWRHGGSSYPKPRIIPYTTAEATAQAAEEALAYWDVEVYLDYADASEPVVCCVRRGHDRADAEFLLPGRQLVVGAEGGWRIEPAPQVAEPAP